MQQEIDVSYDPSDVSLPMDDGYMPELFEQVDQIRDSINVIQVTVDEIKQTHSKIITAPQQVEADRERLESLMADVKRNANVIRAKLKSMETTLDEDQKGVLRHTADFRIRKAQHSTLSRKFLETMEEYNRVQVDYRDKCKEKIYRQLKITKQERSAEDVEEMLEEGNLGVFTQGILADSARMRQVLGDIEARHKDIIKLENSIRELHDMFLDMAVLVQEQGDMIDRIEYNVEKAAAYVESAKKETKKALTYQSSARRKKFICVLILLVGLIIIALIIVLPIVL
ncbi:syntaxin-1A-like [Oscarella lobularis]|uniref:syntaxin-1A-like n=1 Tax=Oscarella lobularis TaxID=121494 RepID=UPI0033139E4A